MEGNLIVFIVLVFGSHLCTSAPVAEFGRGLGGYLVYVSPSAVHRPDIVTPEQSPDYEVERNDEYLPYLTRTPYRGDFPERSLALEPENIQFSKPYDPEWSFELALKPGEFEENAVVVEESPVSHTTSKPIPVANTGESDYSTADHLQEIGSRKVRSVVDGESHADHEEEVVHDSGSEKHYHLGYGIKDRHHQQHDSYLHYNEEDTPARGNLEDVEEDEVEGDKIRRRRSTPEVEEAEVVEPADAEGRHRIRQYSSSNYALSNTYGGSYQGAFGLQNQFGGHGVYDNSVHSHAQAHSDVLGGNHGQFGYVGTNAYAQGQAGYPVGYVSPVGYGQGAGYASAYAQAGGYGQTGYGQSEYYGGNAYGGGYRPGHASSGAYASAQAKVH